MKKLSIATLAVSLLATSINTMQPAHGMEKVFNFEPEMKSVALGAGVTAVALSGLYWFFGKEKPTPTKEKPFTTNQLNEELGLVKTELKEIKEKQDLILKILQAPDGENSPLVESLVQTLEEIYGLSSRKRLSFAPKNGRLANPEHEHNREFSPTRLKESEMPPSPMKSVRAYKLTTELSKCQQEVSDNGKEHISERLLDLLRRDDDCAKALCKAIKEEEKAEAEFDVAIVNKEMKMCKLVITIGTNKTDKFISFDEREG
jgi:hypothetical protein